MLTLWGVIIIVALILGLGFLAWIVESAPFIDSSFKALTKWVLLVIAGLILIVWLLSIVGYGPGIGIK